jgi:hypothetical protein
MPGVREPDADDRLRPPGGNDGNPVVRKLLRHCIRGNPQRTACVLQAKRTRGA